MSIAIPLAGLTVFATLLGGRIGLRFSDRLPTLLALTGGVVVAVALLDVLPEGIDGVGDVDLATALVAAGFLAFSLEHGPRLRRVAVADEGREGGRHVGVDRADPAVEQGVDE